MLLFRVRIYLSLTVSTVPDGHPQNVVAVTRTSTAILVEWEPVPARQRNGYITHYEIELNQTTFPQLNTSELRQTSGAQLMLLLTDLEEFVEYTMRVRAYTSVGAGPFSPNVTNATFTDRKWHIASLMCTLIMCCVFHCFRTCSITSECLSHCNILH